MNTKNLSRRKLNETLKPELDLNETLKPELDKSIENLRKMLKTQPLKFRDVMGAVSYSSHRILTFYNLWLTEPKDRAEIIRAARDWESGIQKIGLLKLIAENFPGYVDFMQKRERPSRRETIRKIFNGIELKLEIATHPSLNGRLIINYPGYDGDMRGYNGAYEEIAGYLQERGVGAIVRTGNFHYPYAGYMLDNLKCVIDYAIKNSVNICGSEKPEVYLMGYSAGAGAIAAVAADYQKVEKILLIAPSGDAGEEEIERGLKKFRGEVYIVIGENDDVVYPKTAQAFYDTAINARKKEMVTIPNCDHFFRGETNGRILSKAPLWAFEGDIIFPSPHGGIKLYE